MKTSSFDCSPRLAIGDLDFVKASLQAALAVIDPTVPSVGIRVRFLRPAYPFTAGEETVLPPRPAITAIQRGDAELAIDTHREETRL